MVTHGLKISDSTFWVIHRRKSYGPFDYEWSKDLSGMELVYQGRKFGEYCSVDEIHADLKEFKLPKTVAEVGTITLGSIIQSILDCQNPFERYEALIKNLNNQGYQQFAEHIEMVEV
jgi:hypothetical protein